MFASYIDEPCLLIDSTGAAEAKYYYHANDIHSVAALTDSLGAGVESYVYSPYGEVAFLDAAGVPLASQTSSVGNPYAFTGRRVDGETGLYYFRARFYAADLGRFVNQDPIGFDSGQSNLYAYLDSSPLDSVDPLGLFSISQWASDQFGNAEIGGCLPVFDFPSIPLGAGFFLNMSIDACLNITMCCDDASYKHTVGIADITFTAAITFGKQIGAKKKNMPKTKKGKKGGPNGGNKKMPHPATGKPTKKKKLDDGDFPTDFDDPWHINTTGMGDCDSFVPQFSGSLFVQGGAGVGIWGASFSFTKAIDSLSDFNTVFDPDTWDFAGGVGGGVNGFYIEGGGSAELSFKIFDLKEKECCDGSKPRTPGFEYTPPSVPVEVSPW